jgi:hypothetical protein
MRGHIAGSLSALDPTNLGAQRERSVSNVQLRNNRPLMSRYLNPHRRQGW